MKSFYSNGKLLLTGEYVVLDGALSLAVPTKFGQILEIESLNERKLIWKSFDQKGSIWFEDIFPFEEIATSYGGHKNVVSDRLVQILNAAKQLNPDFLNTNKGFRVSTKLDFPENWGLGTSSTLINNIAQWANIDAYELLKNTFGGSGYDIACAQHNSPITYQLQKETPITKPISFNIAFKDHLYFVHLNKKQNSRDGIKHYNANKGNLSAVISDINQITLKMMTCNSLSEFENLLTQHESIIAKVTKQTPLKESLFNDFKGSIKSLGAWGGDFILVAAEENPTGYFKEKGFETIIPYTKMVL